MHKYNYKKVDVIKKFLKVDLCTLFYQFTAVYYDDDAHC